jgi:hypothetical protein
MNAVKETTASQLAKAGSIALQPAIFPMIAGKETTASQLAKSEKRKNLASTFV